MKNLSLTVAIITLCLLDSVVLATPIEIISDGKCSVDSIKITDIRESYGPDPINDISNTSVPIAASGSLSYPISSTMCLGYVTDPSNTFAENPSPNIGAEGDGLLNGQVSNKDYYVPGDYFLTHPNDSMVDLNGDGVKNDPGWIRLGGFDNGVGSFDYDFIGEHEEENPNALGAYNLDQILDVTFLSDGTWSLHVDPSSIAVVTALLGRPSIFDHLAFVLKSANQGSKEDALGEWAIFDFNFYELIDDGLEIELGTQAYSFKGEWDNQLFGGKDVSHYSIWAHDPPASNQVPEPRGILLFALSVLIYWRLLKNSYRP